MKTVKHSHAALTAEDVARYKKLSKLTDAQIDFSDIPEMTDVEAKSAVVVRGGYRPGSGRKAAGHVQVGLHLSSRAREVLRKRAKREKKTMSSVIEDMLLRVA